MASITQVASKASLTQTGALNVARIEQADGSSAQLFQTGTGNLIGGIGSALDASQFDASTLLVSQIGTDNRAFIQQASGSYAWIAQSGTGNTVTLIQN